MICPRCKGNTTLWVQKIGQDVLDRKSGKIEREGTKVFICGGCKKDWTSVSSLFRVYWKRVREKAASDADYERFFELFLNSEFRHPVDRRKFSQVAVALVGDAEIGKRAALHIPDADLVTSEDYAWVAGVIDAVGHRSTHENPGKICLVIRHENKELLEHVRDIVGGNIREHEGAWSFTTTHKNSESILKRIDPYLRCSKEHHPNEIPEDDRTLAWITGFAQAAGKHGVITTKCKWAIRLMSSLFPGVETASGEEYSFAPEESMRKRLSIFLARRVDPRGTLPLKKKVSPEGGCLPISAGESGKGLPRGSHLPLPSGPKPNSVPGPNPGGEGSRSIKPGSVPASIPSVLVVDPPLDLTPEIEVSGDTQVQLSLKSEGCLLCRYVLEDVGKDKGFLRGSKKIPLHGKLNHLYAEFDLEIPAECPECEETVPLRGWADDFSKCGFCASPKKDEKKLVDDKKWASV